MAFNFDASASGGGFGFGGSAANNNFGFGAAAPTAATAGGGGGAFTFGGAGDADGFATPAAKVDAASATATAAVPNSGTSTIGAFDFGGNTTNTTNSTAASSGFGFGGDNAPGNTATSNTAAVISASDPLASHDTLRLDNKTLEKIIETWEEDLKEHRSEFTRQRTDLEKWDRRLTEAEEKTNGLVVKVNRIELAQDELAQNFDSIMSQQKELDQMLGALEREVRSLYEQDRVAGPADEERHLGYFLAEKIDSQLGKMQSKLASLVERLNKRHDSSDENPVSLIVETLNAHLNALQWIDLNAQALQSKISLTQKDFGKRAMSLERTHRF